MGKQNWRPVSYTHLDVYKRQYVYVAQIALGANPAQAVKAITEAEEAEKNGTAEERANSFKDDYAALDLSLIHIYLQNKRSGQYLQEQ